MFMSKAAAQQEAVRRFLALPENERATEQDAVAFAMTLHKELRFKGEGSDSYQVIKGWLIEIVDRQAHSRMT